MLTIHQKEFCVTVRRNRSRREMFVSGRYDSVQLCPCCDTYPSLPGEPPVEEKVLRVASFPDHTWTREIKRICQKEGLILEKLPELCAIAESRDSIAAIPDLFRELELVALGSVWNPKRDWPFLGSPGLAMAPGHRLQLKEHFYHGDDPWRKYIGFLVSVRAS